MPRTRYLNKKSLADTLAIFVDGLAIRPRAPELIAVEDSLHRITAEPICARISAPHYHGAAMDGVAVRAEDTFGASEVRPVRLRAARAGETAPAGAFVAVDTGNPLPRWANAVVMIERVYPADGDAAAIVSASTGWRTSPSVAAIASGNDVLRRYRRRSGTAIRRARRRRTSPLRCPRR